MRKVFITGSSKGLGKALAEKFLEAGDEVVGFSRSCSIEHPSYKHQTIDLSKPKNVKSVAFDLSGDYEEFILINNAASLGDVKHLGDLSPDEIIRTFQLNAIAPFLLSNAFISASLNKKQTKCVINIGTGAASTPMDGWSLYCGSKAAINMLAAVYEKERLLQQKNDIKMVTLAPGIIDTEMQEKIRLSDEEDFSNVARFTFYRKNGELTPPDTLAEKIMANFEKIFIKNQSIQSIRDY